MTVHNYPRVYNDILYIFSFLTSQTLFNTHLYVVQNFVVVIGDIAPFLLITNFKDIVSHLLLQHIMTQYHSRCLKLGTAGTWV